MPFKSEKQRKFLWLKHPDIAGRWTEEEKRERFKAKMARRKK